MQNKRNDFELEYLKEGLNKFKILLKGDPMILMQMKEGWTLPLKIGLESSFFVYKLVFIYLHR